MATGKINGNKYNLNKISDKDKIQLASLHYCYQELARLQAQSATLQTARMAFA